VGAEGAKALVKAMISRLDTTTTRVATRLATMLEYMDRFIRCILFYLGEAILWELSSDILRH